MTNMTFFSIKLPKSTIIFAIQKAKFKWTLLVISFIDFLITIFKIACTSFSYTLKVAVA